MNIKCEGCRDTFEIPDGKGITRAVCPFCDHTNDLRAPAAPAAVMPGSAGSGAALSSTDVPVARHPLAPQLWILAICALIVTAIICLSFLFTVISMIEMGKASEKASEELNKASEEINRTMDKANKEMQRSLQHFVKP